MGLCNATAGGAKTGKPCRGEQELYNMTSGGRVFLFVRKNATVNYATNNQQEKGIDFDYYNFFLMPYVYNRINLQSGISQTLVYPDFFFSFRQQTHQDFNIQGYETAPSNVSVFNRSSLLSVNFILNPNIEHVEVVFPTLMDVMGQVGAFWGVLCTMFGLCFLYYNRVRFYEKYPAWHDFPEGRVQPPAD